MSIKAMIVGTVIFIILKIFKKRIRPKYRYRIWLFFILLLIFPVQININNKFTDIFPSFINNDNNLYFESETNYFNSSFNDFNNNFNAQKPKININLNFIIKYSIPSIWIIYLISISFINIITVEKFYYNSKNLACSDKRILIIFEKCKKKLGIKKDNIRIISSSSIKEPSTIGIKDVKILLMEDCDSLSNIDIENILLHELTHYKRKDNLMKIIIKVLENVYFFNLLIIFLLNKVKNEMEYAVDESVTFNLNSCDKNNYCISLIKLSTEQDIAKEVFNNYFGTNTKYVLKSRVKIIKNNINDYNRFFLIIVITFIILALFFVCSIGRKYSIYEIQMLITNSEYFIDKQLNINSNHKLEYNYKYNQDELYELVLKLIENVNANNLFYKYIITKEYYNTICGVFSIYSKTNNSFVSMDIWIDLKTGNLLKEENYYNDKTNIKPKDSISCIEYTYNN
jgi:bla regulator protein BlaR1